MAYSKAEPLEVLIGEVFNTVALAVTQETLEVVSHKPFLLICLTHLKLIAKDFSLERAAREVLGGGRGGGRVSEDVRPLLDSLVVVLDVKSRVGGSVVDLHLGSGSVVARVHVLDDLGPLLLSLDHLALGALRVPSSGLVSLALEAASRDTGIGDSCSEEVGVSGSHDVLGLLVKVIIVNVAVELTVIIAPEDSPVTKTLLESPLYSLRTNLAMLAMEVLEPPPSWVKVILEETSQQLPGV